MVDIFNQFGVKLRSFNPDFNTGNGFAVGKSYRQSPQQEILVIDPNAGMDGRGALFRVDRSGRRTIVSDFGKMVQGPQMEQAPLGLDPIAVAVHPSGDIFVLDVGINVIFRVFPNNTREIFHYLNEGEPSVSSPADLAIDASGNILVIDRNGGTGDENGKPFEEGDKNGSLFRIINGVRERLIDNLGEEPEGIAVAPSGTIMVSDRKFEFADEGSLHIINPTTLEDTTHSFNDGAFPCDIRDPTDLAIEPSGNILIIDPAFDYFFGTRLFRFNPANGVCTRLGKIPPENLSANSGVAVDASGNILVTSQDARTDGRGALFLVGFSGFATFSDFGCSSKRALGADPRGVAIAPPLER